MSLIHKCERCGIIYEKNTYTGFRIKKNLDNIMFEVGVDLCPICNDKLQKFMNGACIMENSKEHCAPGAIYKEKEN